ncbi:hypothetical protein ACNKHR_27640 [Shigella flexneri]
MLTDKSGGESSRETVASQMPRIGRWAIVASWLVALNLLVVSPWTLEACFYNYTVKVPVQRVSLVF